MREEEENENEDEDAYEKSQEKKIIHSWGNEEISCHQILNHLRWKWEKKRENCDDAKKRIEREKKGKEEEENE